MGWKNERKEERKGKEKRAALPSAFFYYLSFIFGTLLKETIGENVRIYEVIYVTGE